MTHEQIQELAALNAIGAASAEEVAELRRHLATCDDCRRAAEEMDQSAAMIALSADPVRPPAPVREQLMRKIQTRQRQTPLWWTRAAAVILLILLGATYLNLSEAREENARLKAERQKLSETIAALSNSGARTIQLAGQPIAPNASARVFLDPTHRRAYVFFNNLPLNEADKSYQLWIIRADQVAPQSAGVFNVDKNGSASLVVENLPVDTEIKALAVTLEPKGGVPAPTGEKYLVGT